MRLEKMPVGKAIELVLREEATVSGKLLKEKANIEQVVNAIARAFRSGGRLFYIGAGTSGRLGVLDASECPPTFRAEPNMVQAIIAGGDAALKRSIEGAEDDSRAGEKVIRSKDVTRKDVVVGVAASGTTRFVWGGLIEAKRRGGFTVLVCFNPYLEIPRKIRPAVVISADMGPEVLTGSTRLKAGTATKLLLNMFTTLAMVRIGKVKENLMVDLKPSNAKLRDRAVRIVQQLTGKDYVAAKIALENNGWVIRKAVSSPSRRRES